MISLNLKPAPFWLDLPRGVRLHLLPATSSLMEDVNKDIFGADAGGDEDEAPEAVAERAGLLVWAKAMARRAVIGWEGVGDETGAEIAPSPDYIEALMEDPAIFARFREKYVVPALVGADEGNG